jgi:hypothetical protein
MSDWERVEVLRSTCVVCGKPDWCLRSATAAICARIPLCELRSCLHCRAGHPKRAGEGGWLHQTSARSGRRRQISKCHRIPDYIYLQQLHEAYRADVQPGQIEWWAKKLGVSAASLERLQMGWSGTCPVGATFPIQYPAGQICGISVRHFNGGKSCIRGSAMGSGLFVPTGLDNSRGLLLTEGVSDAAALLSLGLQAVGRPSISTRAEVVRRFLHANQFQRVVVVADNDGHGAGQVAAVALVRYLTHFVAHVDLLVPPQKDVRSWVNHGADRRAVLKGLRRVD